MPKLHCEGFAPTWQRSPEAQDRQSPPGATNFQGGDMGRTSTPWRAAGLRRTPWWQRWRQPLPLAGVDIGPLDLFWVALSAEAGQVRITQALSEPLPAGWGQPQDLSTWDLAVLGQALQQLTFHQQDRQLHHLALGLDDAWLQTQALEMSANEPMPQVLVKAEALMRGQARCWDVATTPQGPQLLSTPRAAVLTLQAMAEAAGLTVGVIEPKEAAHARGWQWLAAQPAQDQQDLQHHATAIGLALRRFEPWGSAC